MWRALPAWWLLCSLLFLASPGQAEKNLARPPGTTRYAAMVGQLDALLAYDRTRGAHRMQLTSVGRSVRGRDLWMVTLHDPAGPAETRKLFYLCRQHGHEPASTEGALTFLEELVKAGASDPLAEDLKHVTVYIVPMANPDGAEAFLRHNAHDVDLNRDWLRRTQPETQALWRVIQTIRPDLMTDQHELYPNDTRGDFTESAGMGSGASQSVIETCLGDQAVVQASMQAAGFMTASHWIDDHHPARLAHRFGCVVAGIPTILFETNRLSGSRRDVAARARTHEQFMTIVLRDLAGERNALMSEAAAWQAARRRDSLVLASRRKPYRRPAAGAPVAGKPHPAAAPPVVPAPAQTPEIPVAAPAEPPAPGDMAPAPGGAPPGPDGADSP